MPSNSVEYDQQYWLEHGGKHTLKARLARAEAESERLRALLQRLYEWDHMDSAADGAFWRSEIDKALARDKCRISSKLSLAKRFVDKCRNV